jgi:Cysteine-rich secretory protein family
LTDATTILIERWYDANISYTVDPTFQYLPWGRSYTQLVWKASTHIGCAWTPPTCKFDATNAFYLRCAFSPRGNSGGQFEENVSCNGCPGKTIDTQVEITNSSDLETRQAAESSFILLLGINKHRAEAKVPALAWDTPSVFIAETLAQKCNGVPQAGETVGIPISGGVSYIPTLDAIRDTVNAWDAEPHTNDFARSPNFARITNPKHTVFGCGWNKKVCPGDKWYMHCFFTDWTAVPPAS